MGLKTVFITIDTGAVGTDIFFAVKGNLKAYEDVAAVADSGFTATEGTSAELAKVLGVITPQIALLESGAFKRLEASTSTLPKKSRTVLVPSKSVQIITAAVEDADGLSIDGVLCKSVSQGLRRVSR